jgi:uncharacterized Ntn-hydrolase superfamily protein
MTWSLIALDRNTGEVGIAAATKFFAVGARIPFIAPGFGAIATQALVNPFYGIDGLEHLRAGYAPDQVLDLLLSADPGRAHRQAHLIDMKGTIAAHTGECCLAWAGQFRGDAFSVAGNMLAGPKVIERTSEAYSDNFDLPLARRLIVAMQAGQAGGGDRRGKQSASLLIFGSDEWSWLDLRIDDHPDPLSELERLERTSRQEWVRYRPFVPTRTNPAGVTDHETIDAAVGSPMQDI